MLTPAAHGLRVREEPQAEGDVTFQQMLKERLSAVDFARLQQFTLGMKPRERAAMLEFIARRETHAPEVGALAPDFELPLRDRDERVRLSAFRGQRPVALIFGSYT
jgi:hypothetical protein